MTNQEAREIALKVAWSYHGTFYQWGGDDPSGFDCSGLVIEILKSVGKLPKKGDWTANGLYEFGYNLGWSYYPYSHKSIEQIATGRIVFWSDRAGHIYHVEMALNNELSIGASGGGSRVKTREDAIKYNAFIKVRPIEGRGGRVLILDPFV